MRGWISVARRTTRENCSSFAYWLLLFSYRQNSLRVTRLEVPALHQRWEGHLPVGEKIPFSQLLPHVSNDSQHDYSTRNSIEDRPGNLPAIGLVAVVLCCVVLFIRFL